MFLFDWFPQKTPGKSAPAPAMPSAGPQAGVESPPVSNADSRKTERLERRELLYGVVREAMVHAGALSASYKFKVLSLDAGGRQYLIMMDLTHEFDGAAGRLAEIEAAMVQSAQTRHGILVTAVYWRVSHRVVAPSGEKTRQASPYEPIGADEVAAFKQAFAVGAPAAAAGKRTPARPRSPARFTGFEDTALMDFDEIRPPLSHSQYGDLN